MPEAAFGDQIGIVGSLLQPAKGSKAWSHLEMTSPLHLGKVGGHWEILFLGRGKAFA